MGLIRSARAFRLRVELRGMERLLRTGDYQLRRSMNLDEILATLTAGRGGPTADLVTIPEGWRAEEVAELLEARGIVAAPTFMELVVAGPADGAPPLPPGATSFEGYLFPDSYDFGHNPTPESVLRTLVGQFDRRVDAGIRSTAAAHGLSVHGLITLASIVEREAMEPDEREDIAAVYHNRLDRGMPLQADPTVQYALLPFGTLAPDALYWRRDLGADDLTVDSPYNTYRVSGLTPGPICNPGLAAIRAAAEPADSPWLYFVARGDGSHLFARTLDEHLRNVARIRGGG
jgi:UPF0755 protein